MGPGVRRDDSGDFWRADCASFTANKTAPRLLAAPSSSVQFNRSELHGDASVDRRLGAGVVAHAGRDVARRAGGVIEAELVLPVAIGNPDVDEVGELRTPDRLRGIEGQTDRLGGELHSGRRAGKRIVFWALFAITGSPA